MRYNVLCVTNTENGTIKSLRVQDQSGNINNVPRAVVIKNINSTINNKIPWEYFIGKTKIIVITINGNFWLKTESNNQENDNLDCNICDQ